MTASSTRRRLVLGAISVVAGLLLVVVPRVGPSQAAEGLDQFGGVQLTTVAQPYSMLYYDPGLPVPSQPAGELNVAYGRALFASGPSGKALSSSMWPGDLVGDGLPLLFGQCQKAPITNEQLCPPPGFGDNIPAYGVRAEANVPGPETRTNGDQANLMKAEATPLLTRATTSAGKSGIEGLATVGATSSLAFSGIEDDRAVGRVDETASGIEIAGGLLNVGAVRTVSEVSSTGTKAASTYETVFGGVTVAGMPAQLSTKGLTLGANASPLPGFPADPNTLLGLLGVTVSGFDPVVVDTADVEVGRRVDFGGVIVTIDTVLLQQAKSQVDILALAGAISPDLAANLSFVTNLGPKVQIILGGGTISASASPPFVFDDEGQPILPGDTLVVDTPVDDVVVDPVSGEVLPPDDSTASGDDASEVASPVLDTASGERTQGIATDGIGLALVLVGMAVAGGAGYFGRRVPDLVFAERDVAGATTCSLEAEGR